MIGIMRVSRRDRICSQDMQRQSNLKETVSCSMADDLAISAGKRLPGKPRESLE